VTAAALCVLLAPVGTAAAAPPGTGVDATGPGTLPLREMDLDAATIPALQEWMDVGELIAVDLTATYLDPDRRRRRRARGGAQRGRRRAGGAEASDRHRAGDGARSPLEGIAVLLEDNVDTADLSTTAGSRALLGSQPDNAPITRRICEAGGIVIGMANLSEWADSRPAARRPASPPPWRRCRSARRPTARSSARRPPPASSA
jgi:amidase